jgi:rhomboid family GlyGly-CTERM serine protease
MGSPAFLDRMRGTLKSVNCDGRLGLALLAACLLLVLPTLAGEPGRLLLRYERTGLAQGEWWRLATAHLVHLDLRHALLNDLGLTLMWALFARNYSPGAWLVLVLGAAAGVDAGLWLADSTVEWYVGSSGVLHGVMAGGALAHVRLGERDGWALVALLALKLAYEQWMGALPLAGSAGGVDAHLYGVLGGALVAAFLKPRVASI